MKITLTNKNIIVAEAETTEESYALLKIGEEYRSKAVAVKEVEKIEKKKQSK